MLSPSKSARQLLLIVLFFFLNTFVVIAQESESPGFLLSTKTLASRVQAIEQANDLRQVQSKEDWQNHREFLREQLREMLAIPTLDARNTNLDPVVHKTLETDRITVDNLTFQSSPGLYVTANLYRPKNIQGRLPAIVYVCGHAQVKEKEMSLGNKTHYQHHPVWFAENGYIALAIDTIQLGEIEGIHHGLYRFNRWDWPSRGYTPAGVEAWNASRAIDYLVSREDVDPAKLGITGRSGGGATSWFAAAIDPRIQVVIPVAGITDLRDHVIDQCIRGHCDCMFFLNRYGWDYSTLASLIHPRALLIGNTDEDPIFPLDGVYRIQQQIRHVYQLEEKNHLGIHWTSGGHQDTQELQLGAFVWFDKHLKQQPKTIEQAAIARFEKRQLKVLSQIPTDERVTSVQDWFVPTHSQSLPDSKPQWEQRIHQIRDAVFHCVHGRLPALNQNTTQLNQTTAPLDWHEKESQRNDTHHVTHFDSPSPMNSIVTLLRVERVPANEANNKDVNKSGTNESDVDSVEMILAEDAVWNAWVNRKIEPTPWQNILQTCDLKSTVYFVFPEQTGPWTWDTQTQNGVHLRRSYGLVGWSLEGRQVAGLTHAISLLRSKHPNASLSLSAKRHLAPHALHAALLEHRLLTRLTLEDLNPNAYFDGFVLLGILRHCDLTETLAATASSLPLTIHSTSDSNSPKPIVTRDLCEQNPLFQKIEQLTGKKLLQP
jgi:dienelactone hydrolase